MSVPQVLPSVGNMVIVRTNLLLPTEIASFVRIPKHILHTSSISTMPSAAALIFALVGYGMGILVNRTIDDQLGDPITGIMPTYFPEANWVQGISKTCFLCTGTHRYHIWP